MSQTYTLDQVAAMSPERGSYSLDDVRAMSGEKPEKKAPSVSSLVQPGLPNALMTLAAAMQTEGGRDELANIGVGGPLRGLSNIGNTLLRAGSWVTDNVMEPFRQRTLSDLVAPRQTLGDAQRERMETQDQFFRQRFKPDELGFKVGQIATEIAGTAAVPQVLAAPVRAVAGASPALNALSNSIASGGMSLGVPGVGPVAGVALRAGGGAIAGGGSVALVSPEDAGFGAGVGAVLPGAVLAAKGIAGGAAQAVRAVRPAPGVSGADVRAARDVASMAGAESVDDVARVRDALRQPGPQIIPGQLSTPEVLQNAGVSQLQRTVRAVNPAPFTAREAEREAARRQVLERIAPIGNRADVAQEVGNNIAEYAIPADRAARERVTGLFESVDPFNESRVLLPIDEMRAAQARYLGPGTFGGGRGPQQAVNEAERIGIQVLPAVRPTPQANRQPTDLLQTIRRLGGINPQSAGGLNREIAELGRRQTGTTGLVSRNGRTIDEIAETLHERGFLRTEDPAELLDAIHANLGGRPVYGADIVDDAFRGRLDASMGDLPGAERVPRPVTFQQLQNLRSSITEQWEEANRFGRAREAAALDQQRRSIDAALENLAAGRGQPGEFFAPDMVDAYRNARAAHADRMERFRTGPQSAMFRQGGDGLPAAQGAEIPRRFFNGNASQVADAQSFRRLVQDNPALMADLRRYAVSDAAGQVDRFGNLTSAKFNRWLEARAGATGETFTEQQRAWLRAIADDLRRADMAESLGRSSGSDTVQKAASMVRLGMADSPTARLIAGRMPFGNSLLEHFSGPARQAKADRYAGLLLDPERTAGLLDVFVATQQPRATGLLGAALGDPRLYRSAPLLLTEGQR